MIPVGPVAAGLVLAAGAGRRMGRPKATVVAGGRRLLDQAVQSLSAGGCAPVAVVTGADAGAVDVPDPAVALHNPRWDEGQSTSVAVGLAWAAQVGADAVVIRPVDTPGVGAAVVRALLDAWRQAGGARDGVLVATYDGAPGNPVLLGRGRFSSVLDDLAGDEGARRWLAAHPDLVTPVECGALGDPRDLDTPADLDRWVAAAAASPRTC